MDTYGSLEIKKIGKFLTTGPKYRETNNISWEKANVQKLGAQLLYWYMVQQTWYI